MIARRRAEQRHKTRSGWAKPRNGQRPGRVGLPEVAGAYDRAAQLPQREWETV